MQVAVTQDGLTSRIGAGENDGLTLTHAAVVRELKDLGAVATSASGADFVTTLKFTADNTDPSRVRIAVFVQDSATGQILAAADAAWPARK